MSVGDPQQSIYGFTGADIESFENLKNRTNAHLLSLTGCFRCPLAIVRLAQTIKTEIVGKKNYEGIIDQISLKEIVKYAKPDDLILSRLNVDILNILIEFIELDKKVHIHEDQAKEVISQFKNIFFDTDLSTDLNNELQFKNLINSVRFRSTRFIENNSKKYISNNEKEEYIKIELYELETKLKFITNRWIDWKVNVIM
ncbi:MAG: UvrD-helicase domain-containing protein [Saprospiraceae bacterium]|nr:UvrD-helicase domain-containing protein [Candidatus Brachybacter algidus]MBL0120561.1 UvrD-helicase domain-containing protein [Candidatus Brachybacter algidus]